jgi:hypothetical protein
MWQITLYELDEDKVKPKKAYNSPKGKRKTAFKRTWEYL